MVGSFLVAVLFQLFGPAPRIIVSERTTVVTTPVGDNGLPDFQTYWRDMGREGVTHENNAAVLFWEAVWPGELKAGDRQLVSDALGFETEPGTAGSLQPPYSREVRDALMLWLAERKSQAASNGNRPPLTNREHPRFYAANQFAGEVVDVAMTRPWTSEEIPPLTRWATKNEWAFGLLLEAANRPRWWSPAPSLLKHKKSHELSTAISGIQTARDVARALALRAMWYAGEGRPREAWDHLKAGLRLARLLGDSPSLITQLVGVAIDGITLDRVVTLLQDQQVDAALARQILKDLSAMEKPCDIAKAFDTGERIMFAEVALLIASDSSQLAVFDYGETPFGVSRFSGLTVDANIVLSEGQVWYDRLVAAARLPNRKERHDSLAHLARDASALTDNIREPVRYGTGFLNASARSSLIAEFMIGLMLSPSSAAMNAEDRAVVTLDLARVAAGLAVYRAEQGEYPEALEQLTPRVMTEVPSDLYSGQPLIYRKMPDGGYLLYSVFENGKDDGGTNLSGKIVQGEWVLDSQNEYPDYDQVIRVPIPEDELPELPNLAE